MTTRRSATFAGTPEILWATVGDPYHLPRWWPGVERVEEVDPEGFTQVLESRKGRTVRADFVVVEQIAPRRCQWRRKHDGRSFERILQRAEVTIEVAAESEAGSHGATTRVTLTLRGAPGGLSRRGAGRRAGRRAELDQALAELGRIHG